MLLNVPYQHDLAPPEAYFRAVKAKYKLERINAFANNVEIKDMDLVKQVVA